MNELLQLFLSSIYLLVPAYFANMAPVIAKKLRILESMNKPLDNNKTFKGIPILGKNKTYRGFFVAIIAGALAALLQSVLFNVKFFSDISLSCLDYTNVPVMLLFGMLMGMGAIIGDSVESFFKRRLKVPAGEKFVPWDQTDFVIGAYIFSFPLLFSCVSWQLFLCSIMFSFTLHVLVNHIAFYLNIRGEKW